MASFEKVHTVFLEHHKRIRRGERARRLEEGHGYAERMFLQQVWWPAFGQFEHLHPEYEVSDFRDGTRFIDFAFLRQSLRLAIEIDGYGPHSSKMSRSQFSDQLTRQNHLTLDGWRILRFSYDDVNEKPRSCEQMLQQFMGLWFGGSKTTALEMNYLEKEVFRFAFQLGRSITPHDVCELLQVKRGKACHILHAMMRKQLLTSGGEGHQRIRSYRIYQSAMERWVNK